MSVTIRGMTQLRSRIEAIKPNPTLMGKLGLTAVREQKKLVPRRTGNLGRSIGIGAVSTRLVETVATANYARFVEYGTRPHDIVPRVKSVLRFAVGGNATLAGRPRTGGQVVFARRVRHPGTKAQPFMLPGAQKAIDEFGAEDIVRAWNDAA